MSIGIPKYSVVVRDHIDSAHRIKDYNGKCSRWHGHRWEIELCYQGSMLGFENMLIDFTIIKKQLEERVISALDHEVLNDVLQEDNVTAEFLAEHIYEVMRDDQLYFVRVYESPGCYAEYSESRRLL